MGYISGSHYNSPSLLKEDVSGIVFNHNISERKTCECKNNLGLEKCELWQFCDVITVVPLEFQNPVKCYA